MVGYTAMVAYLAVGRAVTLPDLGGGVLAIAAFAAERAQFCFPGIFAILELLLLPMTVLTVSSIGPWVSERHPADLLPASFASMN